MNSTTPLTGILPAIIIISAVITAIISILLLRFYKRATLKGMSKTSGFAPTESKKKQQTGLSSELTITNFDMADNDRAKSGYSRSLNALRSLARIYASGGIAYAIFMTCAYIWMMGEGFFLGRFIWLLACYTWPTVLTIIFISAIDGRQVRRIMLIYFSIVLVVALFTLFRNHQVSFGQLLFFWSYVNLPATLLLLAFLRKKVRAVGPMVLAFALFGVGGSFMSIEIVAQSDDLLGTIVEIGSALGLGATSIFILMLLGGFFVLGVLGWWILKWLGKRYQKKEFSDQSLSLDAIWLTFGIAQSINLAFEGTFWIFTGIIAVGVFKLVVKMQLKSKPSAEASAPSLLLLRVFALGDRSEKLYDQISKSWRYSGSISMIAGPDLVTSSVEPHEFLQFLGGGLSRQFVKDADDLESRISSIDTDPDPDGRYRVNEFFCREDNWKMTMQRLSKHNEVVLMDLRSFSRVNQGCLYELEQLLDLVSLSKIVFVVDESTELLFLKDTLNALWEKVDGNSPNLSTKTPNALIFHLKETKGATQSLLSLLHNKLAA